ncbi:skin secretory protein xP2-like [Schistocerca gregaria]|uniref:skin secretory protein xP2-like n=1 Tax=Schistocerca gregaria TaxID=7010 RepID=UPI00211F2775|nr:skin secretory protein xP2-like [Schistocerca gregaria]
MFPTPTTSLRHPHTTGTNQEGITRKPQPQSEAARAGADGIGNVQSGRGAPLAGADHGRRGRVAEMCSREKDVPALASDAKGVADRRPAALAPSAAPSGPPLMTTSAMVMDLMDTAPETLKTALSAPLPDSEDESSTAPQHADEAGNRRGGREDEVACSDTVENRKLSQLMRVADVPVQTEDLRSRRGSACPRPPTEKPTCALCGGAHVASYRGCEVWKRAIARQRGQTPAPRPKKPATRRPGVSFTAATSGAPSAVPAASAAPAPAASEAVPTPEAPAPPPQLLVADLGTASPKTSAGPRPANCRRGGQRLVGTQRSAPSVEQPQVVSHSESATPPPSSDGAAPAASTAYLANLVAQLTALVTSATKLIEVLSQQFTAAVLMASPAPTAVNTHQLHHGQR